MTNELMMELFEEGIKGSVNTFYLCSKSKYAENLERLNREDFRLNGSYVLAALLIMDEDELHDACVEIADMLNGVISMPKNPIEKVADIARHSKKLLENVEEPSEDYFTPREMAEFLLSEYGLKSSAQAVNRILIKLGYQIKDESVRYIPTGKAHKESVYRYEMVSKHSTLKWSTVLVPKILGEM